MESQRFCKAIRARVNIDGDGHPLCSDYHKGRCVLIGRRCTLTEITEPNKRHGKKRILG